MLTLSTPLVQEDAECLLQQLPGAVLDSSIEREVCVMTFQDFTIFLIRGAKPSRVACCFNSYGDITSFSTVTLYGTVLPEWYLPSRSRIVLIPETFLLVQSSARQALARYLAGIDGDENKYTMEHSPATNLLRSLQAMWMPYVNHNNKGSPTPFPLNTTQPISFRNDLFEGHCLMVVKPFPPQHDPHWHARMFQHKKRRILWQLQGKFRRPLQGVLYAGAEWQQPMRLGLVAQGVARLLLKLVQRFYSNVHYSFGTDEELAHIVIPAFSAMERIIVTPPNETPPVMGEFWEESAESVQLRKQTQSTGTWNTTDTYSMEFFSMYIDLAQWKLVRLPVSGDIALQTVWGESPMNICMYEAPPREKHVARNKHYAFGIQMKNLGASEEEKKHPNTKQSEGQQSGENEDDEVRRCSGSHRPKVSVESTATRESCVDDEGESTEQEEDVCYYFDAKE